MRTLGVWPHLPGAGREVTVTGLHAGDQHWGPTPDQLPAPRRCVSPRGPASLPPFSHTVYFGGLPSPAQRSPLSSWHETLLSVPKDRISDAPRCWGTGDAFVPPSTVAPLSQSWHSFRAGPGHPHLPRDTPVPHSTAGGRTGHPLPQTCRVSFHRGAGPGRSGSYAKSAG